MQVSLPPPPVSTSQVWKKLLPWVISILFLNEDYTIIALHLLMLNPVQFHSQNVVPSPIARRLYASCPIYPHMKPGLQVIDLVLHRFVYSLNRSNIQIGIFSIYCTHMGFLPMMSPSLEQRTMSCYYTSHTSSCWASWGLHISSKVYRTTASTTTLKIMGHTGPPRSTPRSN